MEERFLIEKNRRFIEHKQGFPWKIAFANRSFRAFVTAFFCSQWGNYFFIAWMPVYLQEGRHFSENGMKMFTSYFFIIGTVGAMFAGFLSDWLVQRKGLRFGRRFLAMLGLAMLALSIYIAAVTASNNVVVISIFLGGFFFSSSNGTIFFSTCVDIGGSRTGTVAGIMNFFGQTGAFVLAITFGKVADITHSFNTPMLVLSGILIFGSFLGIFVDPTKPLIPE
jgi:sugar phosphate permease